MTSKTEPTSHLLLGYFPAEPASETKKTSALPKERLPIKCLPTHSAKRPPCHLRGSASHMLKAWRILEILHRQNQSCSATHLSPRRLAQKSARTRFSCKTLGSLFRRTLVTVPPYKFRPCELFLEIGRAHV